MPRLRPTLTPVEVEGEELDTVRVALLQHLGDAGVQLASAPEGEPLVRTVADQRMPETEPTRHLRVALTNSASRSQASESEAEVESPSSTAAIRDPEKETPSTDAQRRNARSPGASRSIRVATSDSTVSGIRSSPSPSGDASSCRNSGFPAPRSKIAASSSSLR